MYLKFLLILLLTVIFSSCSLIKRPDSRSVTVMIDPSNFIDTDLTVSDSPISLEIYILRKSYIFNAQGNSKLTNELKALGVPNLSKYRIYSCQIYNIVPGELVRDRLLLTKDTVLIITVMKKGEKVLSKKFTHITAKGLDTLNIELVGTEIRVNN